MDHKPPPEFGPNGAVLNNPQMGDRLRADYLGKPLSSEIRRPQTTWDRMSHRLVPLLMAAYIFATSWWWMPFPELQSSAAGLLAFGAAHFLRAFWPPRAHEGWIWMAALIGLSAHALWKFLFG
jgi:hypothetical protein